MKYTKLHICLNSSYINIRGTCLQGDFGTDEKTSESLGILGRGHEAEDAPLFCLLGLR